MVDLKLDIDPSFYDEEVRDGYTVSSEIKKVWAVTLDLLNQLIICCKSNDIKYTVAYGTLLGAVRHKGYIPWDNDIDILMERDDYNKFCEVGRDYFKHPYFLQNDDTDFGFTRAFTRLRNSDTTAIQKYEMNAEVPYDQGIWIDIFPMDKLPKSHFVRSVYGRIIERIHRRMWAYSYKTIRYAAGTEKGFIDRYRLWRKARIIKNKKMNPYRRYIETLSGMFRNSNTEYIGLPYCYKKSEADVFKKSDFDNLIELPFEMLMVSAPANYAEVLDGMYGNWHEFVIGGETHGDVIFNADVSYKEYVEK